MNLVDIINKDLNKKENAKRFASLSQEEARAEIRSICMTLTDYSPDENVDYESKGYKLWHNAVDVQFRYIERFRTQFGVQY